MKFIIPSWQLVLALAVVLRLAPGLHAQNAIPAQAVIALSPASHATNVCPDMPLRITFAAPPTPGTTGKIQIFDAADNSLVEAIDASDKTKIKEIGGVANFQYYPVIVSGSEADIYPAKTLSYHKMYYVTLSPDFFPGSPGITDPNGWRFTTRDAPPAAGKAKLTVAANGTGDFCTVQGAVDFIPDGNTLPTTISIRNSTYTELVVVNSKHALTFRGEDRKKTVIEYADNARLNPMGGPYRRGMFLVYHCNDFAISNLTLRNTTPKGGTQAEALILQGSVHAHAIVTNVDLYSFQDTLQINGQAYVSNCTFQGDVDFMWGSGPCFFENCECKNLNSRAYYTQIRNPPTNHGYVYLHCLFDGAEGVTDDYLSRIDPGRFPAGEVVFIDCTLTPAVGSVGWRFDKTDSGPDVHFWEYNSHDSAGKPLDLSARFPASKRLEAPAVAQTIAHYSDPDWVLGGDWSPRKTPIIASQPPAPILPNRP